MIGTTGLDERPRDPDLGGPVPFVCEYDDGRAALALLNKKRVTRCALSRICAMCGASLERPLAMVGTRSEHESQAFHVPPVHIACGEVLLAAASGAGFGVLGQDHAVADWVLVTTGGFEHERPQPGASDPLPTFRPNSIIEVRPGPS